MKRYKGQKGSSGSPGSTGLTGPKGATGQRGMKGDKEERNEGTVYVRWGHDQCPSTAQLLYSGRAGGSKYDHIAGGGNNPQCLPLDPKFLRSISGAQSLRGLMYMKHTQIVTVMFMDVITPMYHVQFVMSVIVMQSTWFLLSTHAPQDGTESIIVT